MNKHLLTKNIIEETINIRKLELQKIRSELSLKIFYYIEEKIDLEYKNLIEILDWQEGRNSHLSKYTNILDQHYFEQEFLNQSDF